MGAITHPKGAIGKRDLNNFQPRLGLAWNFHPKWVFRSSFGIMTVDSSGQGGFDEYAGNFNILQPTGDPRHQFQLQNGPGPISYTLNPDGTVPYTGANFGSRTATWRDPNLRNPYVMNWSAGFQYQPGNTWMVRCHVSGHPRAWDCSAAGTSTAFRSRSLSAATGHCRITVFQAQQNYMFYPQFGTINFLSNFNHNTWHSGNITIEKRYGKGLTFNTSFNFSKSLSNDDSLTYYNRQGQGPHRLRSAKEFRRVRRLRTAGRQRPALAQSGRDSERRCWAAGRSNVSENALSGIPISVTSQRQPQPVPDRVAGQRHLCRSNRPKSRTGTWGSASRRRRRTPTSI